MPPFNAEETTKLFAVWGKRAYLTKLPEGSEKLPFYSTPPRLVSGRSSLVKDVVKCFMCSVKGIERTFKSYEEFQVHLYKDHDMHKDPAMEAFNKYKTPDPTTGTTAPQ